MANVVTASLVHDGAVNVVYNVTGILDTSDYATADFTTIANLVPVPTMLRLDHLMFSIEDGLSVRLYWRATSDVLILPMQGRSYFNMMPFGGLTNPKAAGYTGDLRIGTQGWSAGTSNFTVICEFTKQFS